jgi:ELWxxDGT repeat protein
LWRQVSNDSTPLILSSVNIPSNSAPLSVYPALSHTSRHCLCFFSCNNERGFGTELWRSDGTPEGTVRLLDLYEGVQSSNPSHLVSFKNQLYFAATTNEEGMELYVTSGE